MDLNRYEQYFLKGEWHVHTNYTDGNNTVVEYCEKASEIGIPLIAFTEHVRRDLTYDFNDFLDEVAKAREIYPELIILSGCEAKVLLNGEIDVEKWILKKSDIVIFSYHNFPPNLELYLSTLEKVIKNPFVDVWGHPGLFLKKNKINLERKNLFKIFAHLKINNVYLEDNSKYSLPPKAWLDLCEVFSIKYLCGGDVHSVNEMQMTPPLFLT